MAVEEEEEGKEERKKRRRRKKRKKRKEKKKEQKTPSNMGNFSCLDQVRNASGHKTSSMDHRACDGGHHARIALVPSAVDAVLAALAMLVALPLRAIPSP